MNNFLTQIIATHQGAAQTIQPRLPSLFEPVAPELPPMFSVDQSQPQLPALPRQIETRREMVAAPNETSPEISMRSKLTEPPSMKIPQDSAQTIAPPSVARVEIAQAIMAKPSLRPASIEPEPLGVSENASEPSREIVSSIQAARPIEPPRELVPTIEPIIAQALPTHLVIRPNITRIDSSNKNDEPSPTPIIRVTIGRVEVRANLPAPTQPPRAAQPQPKPSLDEFLKSQRRGER